MRSLALLLLFAACSESPTPMEPLEPTEVAPSGPQPSDYPKPMLDGDGVFRVPGPTAQNHRLRYRDGQLSTNDTCAIQLKNRLNPAIPPMYVNGAPIGFC